MWGDKGIPDISQLFPILGLGGPVLQVKPLGYGPVPVSVGPAQGVSWNCFPLKAGVQEGRQIMTLSSIFPQFKMGIRMLNSGLLRTFSDLHRSKSMALWLL